MLNVRYWPVNLAVFFAKFEKYVRPFWDVVH